MIAIIVCRSRPIIFQQYRTTQRDSFFFITVQYQSESLVQLFHASFVYTIAMQIKSYIFSLLFIKFMSSSFSTYFALLLRIHKAKEK